MPTRCPAQRESFALLLELPGPWIVAFCFNPLSLPYRGGSHHKFTCSFYTFTYLSKAFAQLEYTEGGVADLSHPHSAPSSSCQSRRPW